MNKEELQMVIEKLINEDIKNTKEYSIKINNGKPIFSKEDYKIVEGIPEYFELDEYGRSNGSIALITSNTMPLLINKNLKYLPPYGWTDLIHNDGFFEQCHIIAYSLSAKFSNRKNIFIGTEHLNTSIMAHLENKVKEQIKKYNDRVLYRITMKYKGKNQIPTGIFVEAQSLDSEFSLCEFCYNVQPGVDFKYKDGVIIEDNRTLDEIEKTKEGQQKNTKISEINIEDETKPKRTGIWRDYIINRKTNTYHLRGEAEECYSIKNVEPKYLIETTTKEEELANIDLNACEKCNEIM